MIYTTNFNNADNAIGLKVSIVRKQLPWTEGLYHTRLINLAPSKELWLAWLDKSISWEGCTVEYKKQLIAGQGLQNLIKLMRMNDNITLMCYCKGNCHRHILREVLNNSGIECKEL